MGARARIREWPTHPRVLLRFFIAICDSSRSLRVSLRQLSAPPQEPDQIHVARLSRFAKFVTGGAAQNVESTKGCFPTS